MLPLPLPLFLFLLGKPRSLRTAGLAHHFAPPPHQLILAAQLL
jgi:hypothetical protein